MTLPETPKTRDELMLTLRGWTYGDKAERVVEFIERLALRIVPVELTEEMGDAMECAFSTEGQWSNALATNPFAPKEGSAE